MRRDLLLAPFFVLLLAGCPDAVRGDAPAGAAAAAPPAASSATSAPDAAGGGGPAGRFEKIGDASGNLAVSGDALFVTAPPGIVSLPVAGGATLPVVTDDVHYAVAADVSSLFYVVGTMSLVRASHAGAGILGLDNGADGLTVALDADRVYFAASSLAVKSIRKDGTAAATLRAIDSSSQPVFLGLTDSDLVLCVWAAFDRRFEIVRRAKSAGVEVADVELATASNVLAFRVRGGQAYWLDAGTAIRGAAVSSGDDPPPIAGDAAMFDTGAMTVDDTHVYWASRSQGRLYRAPRATGVPEVVADGFVFPNGLQAMTDGYSRDIGVDRVVVDDTFVYVSDTRGVFRRRK